MTRVDKICLDLAAMDYGPAVQLTIGSLTLTDKMHTSATGQYLDLIHVPMSSDNNTPQQDLLQILYRKVSAFFVTKNGNNTASKFNIEKRKKYIFKRVEDLLYIIFNKKSEFGSCNL